MTKTAEEITIEIRITNHVGYSAKYSYDCYGNKDRNVNGGQRFYYRHAKFRLPSGKPKCERFGGDVTDEQIFSSITKKYSNLKATFILQSLISNPHKI